MPRTPLFRLLQRSFRLSRISLETGIPVDEVAGRAREGSGLTRRQLLGGTAAAAGLALAGCHPFPRPEKPCRGRDCRVVIAGAGIAGLTAGYRLLQRNADVSIRIFEGQDRIGGRMFSQTRFNSDGQVVELGGELIDTGHYHIRRLARELEIPLDDFVLDDPHPGLDSDVFYFDGRRIDEHEVAKAFEPVSWRVVEDRAGLDGDWVSYREPNGGEELDRTPLSRWLASTGAEPWLLKLLDVAYTTEYGLETAEQSALNFLLMIDPGPACLRLFGESDERFHVRGGNDRIPQELAKRLGDRIETGARVEAVARRSDGTFAVSLRRKGGVSELVPADHVVIAVPFTMLREGGIRLDAGLGIPEVQRRAIREVGYGTNSKLMVGFQDRIWRKPELPYRSNGSTLTDLPYQLSWETSRLQRGEAGILTNFTGGRHGLEIGQGTPEEQARLFAGQLDRIFPGIVARRSGDQSRFVWPTFEWSKGSYTCYRPGQWTAFGGVEGDRVGNLHFAGEHTSRSAQGFMEGGCESGERVAAEILGAVLEVGPPRSVSAPYTPAATASRVG